MRILHTSDWHLGKSFHEYFLIEEQHFVLNQILETIKKAELEKNPFSALVVSGDIYDRAIPPVEATTLLNDFLTDLVEKFPYLHVFMISGNHDSASRLSFATSFLEKHNIHLATSTKKILEPIVIEKNDEKVVFYQIPFLHSGEIPASSARMTNFANSKMTNLESARMTDFANSRMTNLESVEMIDFASASKIDCENVGKTDFENVENDNMKDFQTDKMSNCENKKKTNSEQAEKILQTQEELFSEICNQIDLYHSKNYGNLPSVLNAHLFTLGSIHSSSERSNIGTAEQVDVSIFKNFTYGAFGHIHKFQVCDKEHRCYYSGSLLPYNFDDSAESGMLDVEIKSKNEIPTVKRILFNPLHKIATLEGKFDDFIDSEKNKKYLDEHKNDFLQIILTDEIEPHEPFAKLKNIFPNLLVLSSKSRANSKINFSIQKRKDAISSNDFGQIFNQFLNDVYGISEDTNQILESELVKKEKELFEKEAKELELEEKK